MVHVASVAAMVRPVAVAAAAIAIAADSLSRNDREPSRISSDTFLPIKLFQTDLALAGLFRFLPFRAAAKIFKPNCIVPAPATLVVRT